MSKFIKTVYNYLWNTWEYKAILMYLFIGIYFFTGQFSGLNIEQMLISSFTNKIFLVVILYPSFVAMFLLTYQYISKNYNLLLRMGSRKKYVIISVLTLIIMALLLFIKTIIMSVICCIITEHSGFKITNELNYIVNDFIIFIIEIIKIFGTIVIIGLLTLLLEISFKKQGIVSLFLIALLTIIFFGDKMYPSGIFIIDIFNPGFQSHGYTLINSLLVLISYGLIYFITIIMLLYIGIKKKIKDVDIGV